MTSKVIHKVIHKLKRPEEEWYFNATPDMIERFHYLLDLASVFDYSESQHFEALLYRRYQEGKDYEWIDRETAWQNFQVEIEQNIGRIDNDSCSTLATIDDNPGSGRLVDRFVVPPIGRSIERLFLSLEIRYFHPPEKSACQIKQFLEESYDNTYDDDVHLSDVCFSLFKEIGRKEKIAKEFLRLFMQASSTHRGLRVEAQKQIWSLCRYKSMVLILNAITDLKSPGTASEDAMTVDEDL